MDRTTQEVLSRKYSSEMVMLLPLSTGEIAGFNSKRELIGIFTNPTDAFNEVVRNKPEVQVEPVRKPILEPVTIDLDLDKYNL